MSSLLEDILYIGQNYKPMLDTYLLRETLNNEGTRSESKSSVPAKEHRCSHTAYTCCQAYFFLTVLEFFFSWGWPRCFHILMCPAVFNPTCKVEKTVPKGQGAKENLCRSEIPRKILPHKALLLSVDLAFSLPTNNVWAAPCHTDSVMKIYVHLR